MNPKFVSMNLFFLSFFIPGIVFACGGLFGTPDSEIGKIKQHAEKIVFIKNTDGTLSTIVQIQYEGSPQDFTWILPVPGIPEISLSSNIALEKLQYATNPSYSLGNHIEGKCQDASSDETKYNNKLGSPRDINILKSGSIGPYEYTLINVNGDVMNQTKMAKDWLTNNGYATPNGTSDLFRKYFEQGMNLIAFRLAHNASAKDIRPLILKYKASTPQIPIKLAALATQENIDILVWIFGPDRAISTNYREIELNDVGLNWFTRENYRELIIHAKDEAGGHAFITESSGSSSILEGMILDRNIQNAWDTMRTRVYMGNKNIQSRDLLRDIDRILRNLGGDNDGEYQKMEGLSQAMRDAFPELEPAEREDLQACLTCREIEISSNFDVDRIRNAFHQWMIEPILHTEKLFLSQPHYTRFYTTLSSQDMTRDPAFAFDPDLPELIPSHFAARTIHCSGDYRTSEAPWTATLPSGFIVKGIGNQWPFNNDSNLPGSLTIRTRAIDAPSEIEIDNVAIIRRILDENNANIPTQTGCSTSLSSQQPPLFLLIFLGFMYWRKKK